MQLKLFRRRLRRTFRKSLRQVEDLSSQTEQGLDEHLFNRIERLASVRRFVICWILLFVLLIAGLVLQNIMLSSYYQTVKAVPGGIYKEGLLGSFTNANPLFATNEADSSVSKLVFAGLFTYDDKGNLAGDLAKDYSVDSRGTTYTVKLRPNLTWQDGKPLTSEDVVFTYQSIQNPDVNSPLQSGWQGITVTAPDASTVVFKLPGPLASFVYNMTNGIVPKHILGSVPAVDLRSSDFNTAHPVGAGPFKWHAIEVDNTDPATAQQQIALVPFAKYQGGQPKLQEFIEHVYSDKTQLVEAFKSKQLTAATGLTDEPASLTADPNVQPHNLLLRAATMTFFKTSEGPLADQKVRNALVLGSDVPSIIKKLSYPTRIVREPILAGQIGYDPSLVQPAYDPKAAADALNGDGWILQKNGLRYKDKTPLTISLTAADTQEYKNVTEQLANQWKALGVNVKILIQDPAEFQASLVSHNYQAILYGITIGADPDVFVYWHSSQADVRSPQRLNFSEYKSSQADLALEAGRTRLDPQLRTVKYKPFLQAWHNDLPALGMYQPRVLYLTNGPVDGLHDTTINTTVERFINVQNWQIRQAKVTNP
jgi:peptide/nickel transport system substrate-binding protein